MAEGSHSGAAAALASVAALTGSAGPTVGMALSAAAGAAVAAVVAHSAPRLLQCHPPRATWTGAHAGMANSIALFKTVERGAGA